MKKIIFPEKNITDFHKKKKIQKIMLSMRKELRELKDQKDMDILEQKKSLIKPLQQKLSLKKEHMLIKILTQKTKKLD